MERLTGSKLWQTVKSLRNQGKTNKEIAVLCGYGREEKGKMPYFTAFYEALLEQRDSEKRCEILVDNKNKRYDNFLHYLLDAIAYRKKYEYRNDWADRCDYSVEKYTEADTYIVRYNGERIAYLTKDGIQFFMPSFTTKSVKRRINAIMERFLGVNLYQKKGVWYVNFPLLGDVEYKDGMMISYPGLS